MTQAEYRKANWEHVREIERRSHAKNAHNREAYQKKRWAENGDKLREYYRNYFKANRKKRKEVCRKYYDSNKNEVLNKSRERYHSNPEQEKQRRDRYYANNKQKKLATAKRCRKNNPVKYRALARRWRAEQRKSNPVFNIMNSCRCKVYIALKAQDAVKASRTVDLLGCTGKFFQEYLERQFTKEMNWGNYGTYWNVDHAIPVSKFDLKTLEGQRKAFHYSNCQPMIAVKNFVKGNKLPEPHQPFLL